jgi:CRISPR/Cas system-associated endonuclease Cas1
LGIRQWFGRLFRSDTGGDLPKVVYIGSVSTAFSQILLMMLKEDGIHAVAHDESGFPRFSGVGFMPQSRIYVRADQAERATAILEEAPTGW